MKFFLFFSICLVSSRAFSQEGGHDIVIGKSHSIHSRILNEKRNYAVYLPDGYTSKSKQSKTYPVIYLLDGEAHFHSVSGIVDIRAPVAIPKMIVVAIGTTNRWRDLTPTHQDSINGSPPFPGVASSGGGDNFLTFIEEELVAHIDQTYRTMPYRVFIGHSLGGLMALYSAYKRPGLFNAYIVIDPTARWDDNLIMNKFSEENMPTKLVNKSFYIGLSSRKNGVDSTRPEVEAVFKIKEILQTSKVPGLRWQLEAYRGETHASVPFQAEIDGLHFIFESYRIDVEKNDQQAESLREHFKKFSDEIHVPFPPPEETVIGAAEMFVRRKEFDKALDCFMLNIENYPKNPSNYTRAGDMLREMGELKSAQSYYEQALKLNPHATVIKNKIKALNQNQ